MTGRHRNNAAEWVMWAVLLPAVPVVWIMGKVGTLRMWERRFW
jgi:hypothetical protein